MGRTNGKLVDFLKDALCMKKYINLTYDSEKFELDLPRYEKNMKAEYEIILKDWFAVNDRTYVNYSNGKSVLKAAIKKSPYIISLKPDCEKLQISLKPYCKKLQFRFSSPVEIKEKRKRQKERQVELLKYNSKEEMPPSVASSGYISGHDNSPEPFEAHDQLKDSNFDNPIDAVMPNNGDCVVWNDNFFMRTMNDSSYKNMEINDDECFSNTKLDEPGKEECNISKYDFKDLFTDNFDAFDVSLQCESLLVHLPLHADQSSAEADSGTLDNLQLEPLSTPDFTDCIKDSFDLPELPSKSGNMAPEQSLCAGLNQPESAIENSESSSLVQIPEEKQNLWICFDKKHIGPIVEYICKPMNLTSLAKVNSAYQLELIIENSKITSCVLISTTHWEPDRTRKQHMVISDGKYLVVFYE